MLNPRPEGLGPDAHCFFSSTVCDYYIVNGDLMEIMSGFRPEAWISWDMSREEGVNELVDGREHAIHLAISRGLIDRANEIARGLLRVYFGYKKGNEHEPTFNFFNL